jgi:hypothetical protein
LNSVKMEVKRYDETEQLIIVGGIPTSYLGVLMFLTRRGPQLTEMRSLVVFLSLFKEMPRYITASFHNFSKSLFSNYTAVRCRIF